MIDNGFVFKSVRVVADWGNLKRNGRIHKPVRIYSLENLCRLADWRRQGEPNRRFWGRLYMRTGFRFVLLSVTLWPASRYLPHPKGHEDIKSDGHNFN